MNTLEYVNTKIKISTRIKMVNKDLVIKVSDAMNAIGRAYRKR